MMPTGLILAITFLTRLPMPKVVNFEPADMRKSVVWFPVAGVVVGCFVALAWWLGGLVHPALAGLFGVLMWVWITGALHLDGLSDLTDALGASHRQPERFFSVLSDPHVGSFGVVALVIQLLSKFVLLSLAAEYHMSLLLIVLLPAWARLGAAWWSLSLPTLKSGLAQTFAWQGKSSQLWFGASVLFVLSLCQPIVLVAIVPMMLWRFWLKRRLGGQTGDALGAGIELVESGALLLLVVLLAVLSDNAATEWLGKFAL